MQLASCTRALRAATAPERHATRGLRVASKAAAAQPPRRRTEISLPSRRGLSGGGAASSSAAAAAAAQPAGDAVARVVRTDFLVRALA